LIAETKGEGGYIVAPGSPGKAHETGKKYEVLNKGWLETGIEGGRLTDDVFNRFVEILRTFDKPKATSNPVTTALVPKPKTVFDTAEDSFTTWKKNRTWDDLLIPDGWTKTGGEFSHDQYGAGCQKWKRPGKNQGCSATTSADILYVFSSSVSLPQETPLDKVAYLAHSRYAGDMKAAAAEIRRQVGVTTLKALAVNGVTKSNGVVAQAQDEPDEWVHDAQDFASMKQKDVTWLWPGYIPNGVITLLEGPPGVGKTLAAIHIAACISRGLPLPNGDPGPRLTETAILSPEDPAESVFRGRLVAAGADLSKVHHYRGLVSKKDNRRKRRMTLADVDIDALEKWLVKTGIRFLVIDAVMSIMPSGKSYLNDQEVRSALTPLAEMTDRLDIAVILGRHWVKGAGQRTAGERGGGSVAWYAICRSSLQVAMDTERPGSGRRILALAKYSLGESKPALPFTVAGNGDGFGFINEWQEPIVNFDLDSLGRQVETTDMGSAADKCLAATLEYLTAQKQAPTRELEDHLKAKGFGSRAVDSAKATLKADKKIHYQKGDTGQWWICIGPHRQERQERKEKRSR